MTALDRRERYSAKTECQTIGSIGPMRRKEGNEILKRKVKVPVWTVGQLERGAKEGNELAEEVKKIRIGCLQ